MPASNNMHFWGIYVKKQICIAFVSLVKMFVIVHPLSFVLKALSTKHLYVVIKTRWKGLRNLNVYFIIADQSFFSFFSNLDPYQLQTTDTIAPWRDSIFLIPLKGEKDMKTRFRI